MLIVSPCESDDPTLLALVDEMTAELVKVYELAPDARPSPLGPGAQYLLARRGEQPVGCCAVQPVGPGIWELNRVFVSPVARGTGVADALLARAEQLPWGPGEPRIRLETGVRQPAAIRLYERTGYRRIANYPPHEGNPTSVCYQKVLSAGPGRNRVGE